MHLYNTLGSKYNLYVFRAVRSCTANTIRIRVSKHWNQLPEPLRILPSFAIFKSQLQAFCLISIICN